GFVGVKNSAKAEWKHCGSLEAFAYYMSVLQQRRLTEVTDRNVLAYDDRKFSAGIGKGLRVGNAFQIFYWNVATCPETVLKRLLLDYAVRVPCHRVLLLSEKLVGRL